MLINSKKTALPIGESILCQGKRIHKVGRDIVSVPIAHGKRAFFKLVPDKDSPSIPLKKAQVEKLPPLPLGVWLSEVKRGAVKSFTLRGAGMLLEKLASV